jgi:hypothetical protein
MWPLGRVGHVTYSFKIMLFISTEIFYDKLRPQMLSVVPTTNAPFRWEVYIRFAHYIWYLQFY